MLVIIQTRLLTLVEIVAILKSYKSGPPFHSELVSPTDEKTASESAVEVKLWLEPTALSMTASQ